MIASELTYADRIALLRERKLQQTREKVALGGYMDEDDYGTVPLPADFHWEPIPNHPNGGFFGAQGWGINYRSLMEAHPTYVDPHDALAGRIITFLSRQRKGKRWRPEFDYRHLQAEQELYGITSGIGADSHFGPDYDIGLELGFGGLLQRVRHYRAQHGPEKAEFYQGEEDVILGIQDWIRRHVADIRAAEARETRPELQRNLREMAEANAWLVENPPRTLREACQWIAWYGMTSRAYNRDGAGCQLDETLRPYYERDIAAGRITDDDAIFYIACLLLSDTHYNQIGGTDIHGNDITSHVTYLIVEAAHQLGIPVNLTVRVYEGMDENLLRVTVQHLFHDRKGWPRYAGHQALVEGFMRNGYPAELARQRLAVGCHWMALPGREYTMNDTVKINVARVFDVAFHAMLDDGSVEPSVTELWARFSDHLHRAVVCTKRGIDFHLDHQKDNAPELVLNLLCHGPIEKGLDVTDGGVEYYNMCIDGSGLATAADSFAALEQRIEREGVLTWAEIARHIRENYAGAEGERVQLMMKSSERYGRGDSAGDAWAVRVSRLFTGLVKESPTPEGRNLIPGWFSWSSTIGMGRELGATPNGRRAGEPISHGANPDPGFRRDGAPTAMAKAIAAIQPGYGNTAPMQLELDPGLSHDEDGIEKVCGLIKTHFALGGTLLNINILDADKLKEAHRDPSRYPDLVVRVTGFTAYFAALSPEFRQLVVNRIIEE